MSYVDVCEAVESLQRKYCERDPFRLCADMGIKLLYQSLGTDPDAIKGFYLESKRIRTITVNSNLPTVIQRIIVSHELGHAVLHRKSGVKAFHDIGLFDESSLTMSCQNIRNSDFDYLKAAIMGFYKNEQHQINNGYCGLSPSR